jgi:hypothetical protein
MYNGIFVGLKVKQFINLSLLTATESTNATNAAQDQPALFSHLIMICTVCYLFCTHFDIFPQNSEWICPD